MKSLQFCLAGGNVMRYHTHAHTARHQTVAEHSFRAYHVAMYLTDGDVTPNVVHELLHHDVAEAYTGDTPYPAKRSSSSLKKALDKLEASKRTEYNLYFPISKADEKFVKLCDMVEMGLYATEQVEAGAKQYQGVVDNVLEWLDLTTHSLDADIALRLQKLYNYMRTVK